MAEPALDPNVVLRIEGLKTHFRRDGATVKSVDGVDLEVRRGRTLAVVGESGSGKSVTSLSVMRLIPEHAGRIVDGRILYRDRTGHVADLARLPPAQMRRIRGREIAMIFQEPMTSLNPVFTVGDQIAEAVMLHEGKSRSEARRTAIEMLRLVEIPAAEQRVDEYPHRLSGGMRQRVMIALALACRPSLLIADEPTTALDVTIQAQILDLMRRLQHEMGMSMLFITHNLGVVAEIAHDVAVMYAGRVVEQADVRSLFARPSHPYTVGLLSCVPRLRRHRADAQAAGGRPARPRLSAIPGSMPSPLALPPGCAFAPRCGRADPDCEAAVPALAETAPGHRTRCLHWKETGA
ncbi:ABC transporter ATP-binding protein [Arenibaculum sp.]|jgi:peptide/nickel transport system ATP-binding protein|uniref:ABC transporter ATP-binding protein n=1 Tax=Arenibaculum sp. TaxID=2865862 RepID=UPI002E0E616C|nr:ABC transporter ATP-binding protein [Arenibaculum sp.]